MARVVTVIFSAFSYAVFFATFLYLIAFVGNIPLIGVTVDRGPYGSLPAALTINVALSALFGIQHSVMARQGFKQAWTRIVPKQAERSVYVLAASVTLLIMFAFWRPIAGTVWSVEGIAAYLLWGLPPSDLPRLRLSKSGPSRLREGLEVSSDCVQNGDARRDTL